MGKRLYSGLHEELAAELAGLRWASLGYKDISSCPILASGLGRGIVAWNLRAP